MPVNIDFNRINELIGSDAFKNISALGGAFLKSKGENDRADKQFAANNEQTRATLLQNRAQFAAKLAAELDAAKRNEGLGRAVAAMQNSKLGENENFATRNRILSHILPKMQGGNFTPGDPGVAAAMGSRPNPFAGGLPPELLSAIGERSTANAIGNRNRQLLNVDPNASMANFDAMGFAPDATAGIDLAGHRQSLLDEQAGQEQSLEETLQRALAEDYEGIMRLPTDAAPEKKQGFWGKFGNVLKVAAPIGAAFIPGVGPLVSAAIAGAGSAAGSKLAGGSWTDALLSGGLGAASTYGAGKLGGGPRPGQGRGYGILK